MWVALALAGSVVVAWTFVFGVKLGYRWGHEAGRLEATIIDLREGQPPAPRMKAGEWINPPGRP